LSRKRYACRKHWSNDADRLKEQKEKDAASFGAASFLKNILGTLFQGQDGNRGLDTFGTTVLVTGRSAGLQHYTQQSSDNGCAPEFVHFFHYLVNNLFKIVIAILLQ